MVKTSSSVYSILNDLSLKLKKVTLPLAHGLFLNFYKWSPNVVEFDLEYGNVFSTLPNGVQRSLKLQIPMMTCKKLFHHGFNVFRRRDYIST